MTLTIPHHIERLLSQQTKRWLITGGAGFIGSHVVEVLLRHGQEVTVLDNLSTGSMANLFEVVHHGNADRFRFIEGDIRDAETCSEACQSADIILHQAALGSVPRSIDDPITSNAVNADGTLNMLVAAVQNGVERFVYASSSAVYGDTLESPKREQRTGKPLSPYAVTKLINEHYAQVFADSYGLETIGLRYFNVFGPRQNPNGPYAAVIPCWLESMLNNVQCVINGDGSVTRDFCFIENVVQANLLAALSQVEGGSVFNIACNESISLLELYRQMERILTDETDRTDFLPLRFGPPRPGDIKHSLADISKAQKILGYSPSCRVIEGLERYINWRVDKEFQEIESDLYREPVPITSFQPLVRIRETAIERDPSPDVN